MRWTCDGNIERQWRLHTICANVFNWQSLIYYYKYFDAVDKLFFIFFFLWNNHFNSNLFTAASNKLINKIYRFNAMGFVCVSASGLVHAASCVFNAVICWHKYAKHKRSIKLQRDRQLSTGRICSYHAEWLHMRTHSCTLRYQHSAINNLCTRMPRIWLPFNDNKNVNNNIVYICMCFNLILLDKVIAPRSLPIISRLYIYIIHSSFGIIRQ